MIDVVFDNIAYSIQKNINKATLNVKIAVAWFTNEELFRSVINALNRGVSVSVVILDDLINRNELALDFSQFIQAGGKLYFSDKRKMHNKFCVIDDKIVLTGSYNWTYYAENLNWENLVIIDNVDVILKFSNEFEQICKSLNSIDSFTPIKLSEIDQKQLYDNYTYLSNDLCLKSKLSKEWIEAINNNYHRHVKIEADALNRNFDYRGIPLLQKERHPIHYEQRLVNIYIKSVPLGMPNANRKFVHAQLITNDLRTKGIWVDIIDDEYVEEMNYYFHKRDGGILDDDAPLPSIPFELYTPGIKYRFRLATCYFKDKKEHQKYNSTGQLLPNQFKSFNVYTRIGADARDYIGFDSLTEQFQFIISSLFKPNKIDDIDPYLSFLTSNNGVYNGSVDDSFFVHKFINEYNANPQYYLKNVLKDFNCNPLGFYIKWINGSISALLYGGYINHSNIEQNDWINAKYSKEGEWFVFKYCYNNPTAPSDYCALLEFVITTIQDGGAQGILTLWWQEDNNCSYKRTLLSLGFKPEPPVHIPNITNYHKKIMQYRLTFDRNQI